MSGNPRSRYRTNSSGKSIMPHVGPLSEPSTFVCQRFISLSTMFSKKPAPFADIGSLTGQTLVKVVGVGPPVNSGLG